MFFFKESQMFTTRVFHLLENKTKKCYKKVDKSLVYQRHEIFQN